ncbi:MAG: NADPH:quinone oxidoreductase [Sphingopyxis macrogoltabida]|uniref:NADPH:quinone oxidoreductase n=1 Tax=Sphingopyxis macrogoltabida TaxID=33050 RepID=A0A2W5N803_SPHMC|nr:MAG: NADPH:quinone oxidoreductase [Sphingopyxis macrogoltabida]
MKALLSVETGGPETLRIGELAAPSPAPDQILVDVHACAINYPDTLLIVDQYQMRPPRPFAPGGEVAGVVAAVGADVKDFSIGDRVFGAPGVGGLAEQVAIDAANSYHLPADKDFVSGSALLLTYGTSIHALVDRGRLQAGETLLVLGAAGGVGLAAVEIGKALGARVIGAVSSEEKAKLVRSAGAHDVIVYPHQPLDKGASKALADQFKAAVGSAGADVVYDAVGGDYCEPAVRSIAWEGRYLVVGFPAGIPRLPLNLTLLKSCDVCGVFWGAFAARAPDRNRAHIARLLDWWSEGKIAPHVTATFPLDRGGDAIAALAERAASGKLVVTLK